MDAESERILTDWLVERDHTPEEIQNILQRLERYDAESQRQSLFDSIGAGSADIEAIVRRALEEEDDNEDK